MKKTLILILLISVLMVTIIYKYFIHSNPMAISTQQAPPASPTIIPMNGRLYMQSKDGATSYNVNVPLTVTIYADSNANPISGFDAVLSYDPTVFQYVSYKNNLSDYQLFSTIKKGTAYVTGVKKISSTLPFVFANTPLFDLTFVPLQLGEQTLKFEFIKNSKTTSNLISNTNKEVLENVIPMNLIITP